MGLSCERRITVRDLAILLGIESAPLSEDDEDLPRKSRKYRFKLHCAIFEADGASLKVGKCVTR